MAVHLQAQIYFLDDPGSVWFRSVKEIKKHRDNKTHIKPQSLYDFDKKHVYFAKSNCNENCTTAFHHHETHNECRIIKLVDLTKEKEVYSEQDSLDKRSNRLRKPKVITDLGSLTPAKSFTSKTSQGNKNKEKTGQIFARSKSVLSNLEKESYSHNLLQSGVSTAKENVQSTKNQQTGINSKTSASQINNYPRVLLEMLSPNHCTSTNAAGGHMTDNVPDPLRTPRHRMSRTPSSLYDGFESFEDQLVDHNRHTHSHGRSPSRNSNESNRSRSRSRSNGNRSSRSPPPLSPLRSIPPVYSRGRLLHDDSEERSPYSSRYSRDRSRSHSREAIRQKQGQRHRSRSGSSPRESPRRRVENESEYNADVQRIKEVFESDQSALVDFKGRGDTRKFVTASIDYYYLTNEGKKEKKARYKYDPETHLIYLGEDIYVNSTSWLLLQSSEPEEFIRTVAIYIWKSADILANRALQLSRVQNSLPNRSPTKRIEKNRLRLLISLFDDFLENKANYSFDRKLKSMLNVTVTLSLKIRDCKRDIIQNHKKKLEKQRLDQEKRTGARRRL